MLSDTQFEQLIEKISLNRDDRERLVRIETMVQLGLDGENKCRSDMLLRVEDARKSSAKAHERIDIEERARTVMVGGFAAILAIITITGFILKLTGHI